MLLDSPISALYIQRIALRKLTQIHGAASLSFFGAPPANRLEKLAGDREGQWSIRINDQWRICFKWRNGDAEDVKITDYHCERARYEKRYAADSSWRDSARGFLESARDQSI